METDIEKIKHCVSLWLDGESTDQQEQLLRDYFSTVPSEDVPQDLQSVAALFRGSAALGKERMPHPIALPRRKPNHRLWWSVVSVAAVALAALLLIPQKNNLLNESVPQVEQTSLVRNEMTVVRSTECSQNEVQMTEQTPPPATESCAKTRKATNVQPAPSTEIYGYDYDGTPITNEKVAMESAEYLSYLGIFNENISTLSDF